MRKRNEKQKERRRSRDLNETYGIRFCQYQALLERQSGGCAICGRQDPIGHGRRFHVDHDHQCCSGKKSCGKCIRGLLCSNCNTLLGLVSDHPGTLERAAEYIRLGATVETWLSEVQVPKAKCPTCGNEFEPTEFGHQPFCSYKCKVRVVGKCLGCGKDFTRIKARIGTGKFCTHACYRSHRGIKHHRVPLLCQVCGGEYERKASRASKSKTCSNKCRLALLQDNPFFKNLHAAKLARREQWKRKCIVCKNTFTLRWSRDTKTYCSRACFYEANVDRQIQRRSRVSLHCEICAKPYEKPKSRAGTSRFCSQKCAGFNMAKVSASKRELKE